ncbi:MAG TPA: DUF418 domain-containing protein [Longimicrobiaceae bacterium]|nr:DUF418 domain-containing protein [Longimicrobiaceae bacterium]
MSAEHPPIGIRSAEGAGSAALAAPLASGERILTLDVLRGIALFGVLTANVWEWFSGLWFRHPAYREELLRLTADSVTHQLMAVLVSGKAVTTFSFLFGLGFAVQMLRAETRGASVVPVYARRLTVLLLVGAGHAVFLWYGDILSLYALLGFALLFFRRRSDRTLIAWAVVLGFVLPVLPAVAHVVVSLFGAGTGAAPAMDPLARLRATSLAAFQSGSYAQVVQANLRMTYFYYLGPFWTFTMYVFAMFLLGLYAGRRRVLQEVERHRAAFRRLVVWGLSLGLAGNVAESVLRTAFAPATREARPWLGLLVEVLDYGATPLLAFGYIAAVTLLLRRADWRRRLAVFAPVGRMALTNYLAQTVICLAIFYSGGLVGRTGPAAGLLIALLIYAVQMAWSPWWLARFHFGPMEWLWRSLTYGRPQPMRIRGTLAVPAPA